MKELPTLPTSADPGPPKLRGWFHAGMVPLVIASGVVLITVAKTTAAKVAGSVFQASAFLLFANSALYHLGHWGKKVAGVLRRFDHSNIALIIAGTYTPLAVILLDAGQRNLLLWLIWGGALTAITVRLVWMEAPRWSYVPIYIALGWTALWFMPSLWRSGGPAVVWLLLAGGLSYTGGAVIYALKRPNPWPKWLGFHELFHIGTLGGYTCHFLAVMMVTLRQTVPA